MGEERTLYESETSRTVPEVIEFLKQLSYWLGDRRLAFNDGQQTVEINIPDDVMLEIEIEEEEDDNRVKRKLEIEIEWIEERAS